MIFEYIETESTQEDMKELFRSGDARIFDAVTAFSQTAGKGRFGKTFYSPDGGLYLSMLLPFDETGMMTRAAGACAASVIREMTGKDIRIKPVNDLYLDGLKVAGILAEAVTDLDGTPLAVVLGIGINLVSPEDGFPEDIRKRAGALYDDAAEIGWMGGFKSMAYGSNELSSLLTAGLRSQLMYALIKEFKRLAAPSQCRELLLEYESLLLTDWPGKDEEENQAEAPAPRLESGNADEEQNEG